MVSSLSVIPRDISVRFPIARLSDAGKMVTSVTVFTFFARDTTPRRSRMAKPSRVYLYMPFMEYRSGSIFS